MTMKMDADKHRRELERQLLRNRRDGNPDNTPLHKKIDPSDPDWNLVPRRLKEEQKNDSG